MPKPFANAPHATAALMNGEWLLGIQTGNNSGDSGLPQMKYIKLSELTEWVRTTYGQMWRYRGPFSASLPSDPQVNDYFLATALFSVGGKTYEANHLYAYNGSSWDDISNVLTQYASQSQVTDIDNRLTVVEVKVDAMGDGIVYKGKVATYADLAGIVDPQRGWEYYVTGDAAFYVYNGASWDPIDNGVVQTITSGDISHAPSADAVYNAFEDEATAREAADNNLQGQIVNINGDIDNIEALIGDEAEVENTDPSSGTLLVQSRLIHHANMLPNGSFGRVGARATQFNQLCFTDLQTLKNLNTGGTWSGSAYTYQGITYTVNSDGSITVSGTASAISLFICSEELKGGTSHKYFIQGCPSGGSASTYMFGSSIMGVYDTNGNGNTYTIGETTHRTAIRIQSGVTVSNLKFYPKTCDMTAMNLASLTASQFRSLFPATYYPHDTGHIYNLNPTGFRIRGVNQWDEETESGYIGSTGTMVSDANSLRSKNFCSCKPNTEYYFLKPSSYSQTPNICWYDSDKNFIERSTATGFPVLTPPNNACYFKLSMYAYGSTYQNNIQIAFDSLPTSVKTVYHSYDGHVVDTPQISDCHYVNENCYDYVENVVEDGVLKGKKHSVVGSYTFTGNEDWVRASYYYKTTIFNGLIKRPAVNNDIPNIICSEKYIPTNWTDGSKNYCIYVAPVTETSEGYQVLFKDVDEMTNAQFKAYMTGKTVNYQLAIEEVTDCEPLRSFGISDYATIEPITPQTQLVNRIDVPFSVKTVSANTLIEQIKQNTADISTQTQRIDNHEARLQNLESAKGDYVPVDSDKGVITTPSGKGKWAVVEKLRGVSRVKNNWNNGPSATFSVNGVTFTNNGDGSVTLSGTASSVISQQIWTNYIPFYANHVYFIGGLIAVSGIQYGVRGFAVNNASNFVWSYTVDWTNCLAITIQSGTNCNGITLKPTVTDLNTYFGTSDLSFLGATDSAKLATIQTYYPELLEYSSYNEGSLVDSVYEGVKLIGRNLIDWSAITADAFVRSADGEVQSYGSGDVNATDYIPVVGGSSYFLGGFTSINYGNSGAVYDINKNFIVAINHYNDLQPITIPANGAYVRLSLWLANFSDAENSAYFTLNSNPHAFTPYMTDTLSLPAPVKLRSAGSVAEEFDLESGEKTNPLGSVDLGTLNWSYDSGRFSSSAVADMDASLSLNMLPNFAISKYVRVTVNQALNNPDKSIYKYQNMVGIIDSAYTSASDFKTAMSGVILYYEKATPTTEQLDPIQNPTILTEPGGTISAQTEEPIDGNFSVGFITL